MNRTLIINWDTKNPRYNGPSTEVFKNIKTLEKAEKLLNKRILTNVLTSYYEGTLIYERPVIENVSQEEMESFINDEIVEMPSEFNEENAVTPLIITEPTLENVIE